MVIERQNKDIVIRLNSDLFKMQDIQRLVDYFRLLESVSANQGTEEQAADLAREVEVNWWQQNRSRFIQ